MTTIHIRYGVGSVCGTSVLCRCVGAIAAVSLLVAASASEITFIEGCGFGIGTRRDYSGTEPNGSFTWVEEVRELDETTFAPTPTHAVERRRSGELVQEQWYEAVDNELLLRGIQLPDKPFVRLSAGAVMAWRPTLVGDERVTKSTFPAHGYTYSMTVAVTVLAEEQVVLSFATVPAFKQRVKSYTVGPGLGELSTWTQWVVPFLGIVKHEEEGETRELQTFSLAVGGRVVTPDSDADEDGLEDYRELVLLGTDWLVADTDGDGFLDGWELDSGFDPLVQTGAALTPSVVYETSVLTATASGFSCADYRYQWERNDANIPGATGATLTGADFSKGDVVACVVTPWDGTQTGTGIKTAPVTILNSPPVFGDATIVAEPPDGTTEPTVIVSGWADADGDLEGYRYQWQLNGVDIAGATDAVLDSAGLIFRDVIACTVTAWDGEVEGTCLTCDPVGIIHTEGPDVDQDELPDGWEIVNGLDPTDANDADQDTDRDGVTNRDEYAADTDPQRYVIVLQPGWNLSSIAGVPVDHTVAAVFGEVIVGPSWAWSAGAYVESTELDPLAGQWIYSGQSTSAELDLGKLVFPGDPDSDGDGFSDAQEAARGTDPAVYALQLHYGWNMVSLARCPSDNRAATIFGTAIRYPVWHWLTDHYAVCERLLPLHGYWVFCQRQEGASIVVTLP